ncbi:unnamed protein product [Hyaloperonospora brassicae]|uniref:HNH nuclease domain-containing protein n=1 Tax=Hyaloperonospora brassicae TaxID=162125 RepID=A0AAV0UR82_HYABA|nr:unnamed protein product [Hyaloperonospora brassicae]
MDDEREEQKRVASLSTVSLDPYSEITDEAAEGIEPLSRSRCMWAPFVVMAGLLLVAVGLVLVLDADHASRRISTVEEDPLLSALSSNTSAKAGLKAPAQTLMKWLEQAHRASEVYVEGGSSDMDLNGVLFPQHGTDALLPFNAMLSVTSGITVTSQRYIAVANGRGYKWTVTSFGVGDNVATQGCLTAMHVFPYNGLDSIVRTANWTSSSVDEKNEVNVRVDGETYTVYLEDDYLLSNDRCWTIERHGLEFAMRVCTSATSAQVLQTEYDDLFNATAQCPQLAPNATQARTLLSVPLPLRKWYASYQM